jgi:hypothetical protein
MKAVLESPSKKLIAGERAALRSGGFRQMPARDADLPVSRHMFQGHEYTEMITIAPGAEIRPSAIWDDIHLIGTDPALIHDRMHEIPF